MLILAALAAHREVIVSRGELVEIGGGFRVPEVMEQSRAILREVGTTNRTRASDYEAAVTRQDGAHPAGPPFELHDRGIHRAAVACRNWSTSVGGAGVPVVEDLGSGNLAGGLAESADLAGFARPGCRGSSPSSATSRPSRPASRPASTWCA